MRIVFPITQKRPDIVLSTMIYTANTVIDYILILKKCFRGIARYVAAKLFFTFFEKSCIFIWKFEKPAVYLQCQRERTRWPQKSKAMKAYRVVAESSFGHRVILNVIGCKYPYDARQTMWQEYPGYQIVRIERIA